MRIPGTMRARLAIGSLVIPLTLACGGGGPTDDDPGDGGGGGGGNNPPVAVATVSMLTSDDGYSTATNTFSPSDVNLTRNGSVTWSNATGILHNVTFSTPNSPANVASMANGSASRTFGTAGTFAYQCTNHAGMTGTVTVSP